MITIRILPNILRSKGNQAIKFGQLIEYNKEKLFFKNDTENELGTLIRYLFVFLKSFI